MAAGRAAFIAALTQEANRWGLPPDIADAVTHIESGYDPTVVGSVGEIGLMQVRPSTAEMLGFHGNLSELADPQTNLDFGVRYLAGAWRLSGGDVCRALMKYRAGHDEEWMSPLSADYCQRAKDYLISIGSPLAAQISVPLGLSFESTRDRGVAIQGMRERSTVAQLYRFGNVRLVGRSRCICRLCRSPKAE